MLPAGWTFWLTTPGMVSSRLWSRRLTARRAVFDTNLFAPLAVLRAALPSLRKNRGRVLQLSSMLGEVAWLGSGVYSASKAAIEFAMEGLALELAPFGVRVTIVVPGIFATDFAATARRV